MRIVAAAFALILCVGFAALAVAPWIGPQGEGATRTAAREEAEAIALELRSEAAADLSAFVERPLFSAARRPPPPEAPGVPVEDPEDDRLFGAYEIVGVVKLGDATVAMVRNDDGALLRLRAGDELETRSGAARVIEITLERLTFQRGGDTVVAPVEE